MPRPPQRPRSNSRRRPVLDGPRRRLAEDVTPFPPHTRPKPRPSPNPAAPAQAPAPLAPTPPTPKPAPSRSPSPKPSGTRPSTPQPTAPKPARKPLLPDITSPADAAASEPPAGERLQKLLAQAGVASRRAAEQLILEGRVELNGTTVTELGTRAIPGKDHVRVDGKLLHGPEPTRWFLLNKPRGYVTTLADPQKRRTVADLLLEHRGPHEKLPRLYPVGRLDYLSEGLLLMTNDGGLANSLSKASSLVQKTYLVKTAGMPTPEALDQLRRGIMIDRGRLNEVRAGRRDRVVTAPAEIEQVRGGDNPWFQVTLIEGRNRQLRKMFEEVGHHVEKIRRIAYGALQLDVEPGHYRELTPGEVTALHRASRGRKVERKRDLPASAQLKKPVPPRSARKKKPARRQPRA